MPFVKGDPNIHRGGRPKGVKNFTTKIREALEKVSKEKGVSYEELLVRSILEKAIDERDTASQKLIWNYLDGLPMATTDLTSGGKPIFLPSEILKKHHLDDTSSESETSSE